GVKGLGMRGTKVCLIIGGIGGSCAGASGAGSSDAGAPGAGAPVLVLPMLDFSSGT
ncbi:hypothetical protein A2U01_0071418, partial [Trifolium medium]|nr:hypothetical protein [Trifolium medium]